MVNLRVALLQFSPTFKDVKASIERADEFLEGLEEGMVDMLVLPEMAFTGYCFTSQEDVLPFLEYPLSSDPKDSPSLEWGRRTAIRLKSYVLLGFPRIIPSSSTSSSNPVLAKYYNSALIISPSGSLLDIYQKHFLYETDERWAEEGSGFRILSLPFSFFIDGQEQKETLRISPCICMDLNPYKFESSFENFEYARFVLDEHKKEKVDLVVCMMNWLDSSPIPASEEEGDEGGGDEWEAVSGTINYWAMRLSPLLGSGIGFVGCNRVGEEGETKFTGSSAGLVLGKRPRLIDYASKKREEVLILEVPIER